MNYRKILDSKVSFFSVGQEPKLSAHRAGASLCFNKVQSQSIDLCIFLILRSSTLFSTSIVFLARPFLAFNAIIIFKSTQYKLLHSPNYWEADTILNLFSMLTYS